MKKIINKLLFENTDNNYIIFIRYIITGGFVTLINFILLYLLVEFLKIHYIISNIISMIICIIITYIISKKIVFTKEVKIGRKKEFLSYIIIAILSIIIDTIILNILTEKLAIYYLISKIISTGISTITNYLLKKRIYEMYKY